MKKGPIWGHIEFGDSFLRDLLELVTMDIADFRQLLKTHPEMLEDGKVFAAFLRDLYPTEKGNVNLLVTAHNAGIVAMLRNSTPDNLLLSRIIKVLENDYGIATEKARWAAELWIGAYTSITHTEAGKNILLGQPSSQTTATSSAASNMAPKNLKEVSGFFTKIVGVTHNNSGSNTENRQAIIQELLRQGCLDPGRQLLLELDPKNPFHENAVKVIAPDGRQLGYLSRETADIVAPQIRKGDYEYRAFVSQVTGGIDGFVYGINIRIVAFEVDTSGENDPIQEKEEISQDEKAPSIQEETPTKEPGVSTIEALKMSWKDKLIQLAAPHIQKVEDELIKELWDWHKVSLTYRQFGQNIYSKGAIAFLCKKGYMGNGLFLRYEGKEYSCELTENKENVLAFDIRGNTIFALLTDTELSTNRYSIKSYTLRDDLPILKETLYCGEIDQLPDTPDIDEAFNIQVWDNSLLIFSSEVSGLVKFSLPKRMIESCDLFDGYALEDLDVLADRIWAIVRTKDEGEMEYSLVFYDLSKSITTVLSSEYKLSELHIISEGDIEFKENNEYCSIRNEGYIINGKEQYTPVFRNRDACLVYDHFFISAIDQTIRNEDSFANTELIISIISNSQSTDVRCISIDGYEIDYYCLIGKKLLLSVNDYNYKNAVLLLDLETDQEPVSLTTFSEYIRMSDEQDVDVAGALTMLVDQEVTDWENSPLLMNPKHKNLAKKISQYSLHIQNYGSCKIKNCSRAASDIMTVHFSDGRERTFSIGILGNTATVENDSDGKKTAQLIELVNEIINCPRYLPKHYESKRIPWLEKYNKAAIEVIDIPSSSGGNNAFVGSIEGPDIEYSDFIEHASQLDFQVRMYIIMENEAILGRLDRDSQEFYSLYKKLFPTSDMDAVSRLRDLVVENVSDSHFCQYYLNVWNGYPIRERFAIAVLPLFDNYYGYNKLLTAEERMEFSVKHTEKWFSKNEADSVEELAEEFLEKLRNEYIAKINSLPKPWRSFDSACPYLQIIELDQIDPSKKGRGIFIAPNLCLNDLFQTQVDFGYSSECYGIALSSYGEPSEILSIEITMELSQFWNVPVSEIWLAALKNMILVEHFYANAIYPYCRVTATALTKCQIVGDNTASVEVTTDRLNDLIKETNSRLSEANHSLGLMYYQGAEGEPDYQHAVEYFTLAAEGGFAAAQHDLAVCYDHGEGVQQNFDKAADLFQKAAIQGHLAAQYALGIYYLLGKGVNKDPDKAAQWFKKAAEQGYAEAQYNLGVCYEKGDGVPKDLSQAKYWFQQAAVQGYNSAINALKDEEYQ